MSTIVTFLRDVHIFAYVLWVGSVIFSFFIVEHTVTTICCGAFF
jgi:uncharacterized membrane protein